MRAFVALEVAEPEVIDALVAAQGQLSRTGADLKLVERENLHFTIRFLGEISKEAAADVDSRLRRLSLKGGEVEVKGMGAFPSEARPRVVWSGVSAKDEATVLEVADSVAKALEGVGQPEEKPFHPHITLARVRSPRNSQALTSELRSGGSRSFGSTNLSAFKLKSSTLTPKGPVYSDVGEYSLS